MCAMSKKALLNAKVYRYYSDTLEGTNLLLINGILSGTGYIPDDDDSEEIDLKGSIIIPDSTLLIPKTINSIEFLTETPFTNVVLPLSIEDSKDDYYPYELYPLLKYKKEQLNDKESTPSFNFYGLADITSENTDDHEVIFKLAVNAEKPIITSDDSYELDYLLNQQMKYPFHLHVCCSSIKTIERLIDNDKITFSVDLSLIENLSIYDFLKSKKCMGFSLLNDSISVDYSVLFKHLTELEVCQLFTKKPHDLLKANPSQLKLNKKPSLKVLDTSNSRFIKQSIIEGLL
jgi:hypothetical protein